MSYIAKYRTLYLSFFIAAAGAVYLSVTDSMGWWLVASVLQGYFLAFLGTSIVLHRYFTHSSFKTGPLRHKLFLLISILNGQGSPVSWSSLHLYHHQNSDTESDVHGPKLGFFNSVFLWGLFLRKKEQSYTYPLPKHLIRQRDTMWVHKNYFNVWAALVILVGLLSWKCLIFFLLAPAAFSIVKANTVSNYLSHTGSVPGSYKNYDTNDNSYNNKFLQYMFGEGLHNNHHKYMSDFNQAKMPGEHDPAAWLIEKFFKV